MATFDNFDSLFNAIKTDMQDVNLIVASDVLDETKLRVKQVVYDPYYPTSYIRREDTGGFLGSWQIYQISPDLYNIYSDGPSMELNPPSFVHGKVDKKKGTVVDRRDKLDEYIATGKKYDFYVPKNTKWHDKRGYGDDDNWWTKPRQYMEEIDYWLEVGQRFNKFVVNAFNSQNIRIR